MRIATWNVDRPKPNGWKVPPAQLERMAEVDADVWVLTETHLTHKPSASHAHVVFSPPHPERRMEPERWTAIWSRWPLTPVADPAAHRRGTVAAFVKAPYGRMLIYGTVIAWANEKTHDDGRAAPMWDVHLAEIERQGSEWARLRAGNPNIPFVVAGDFNQSRDGSRWYGSRKTRDRLDGALGTAGLVCVTEDDMVANGSLKKHHLVDHVCLSPELADRATVLCWENVDANGQVLSDHPVVAVDIPPESGCE